MNLPAHIGIYGGGRMGAGIAHAFLISGAPVTIIEADDAAVAAAYQRVSTSLTKAAERGTLPTSFDEVFRQLTVLTDPEALADCALVVEAVPEIANLKAEVLSRVEGIASQAILATNTSSLSVDGLAASLVRPERFIGLHFFNPVPSSDLIEIVVGSRTDAELVSAAKGWVDALGKTAITVKDSPGFASSRLGVAIALEAMRMLEDGVASAADIDTAMTHGYKHPMGPRLAIAEHLAREVGPRFDPPTILRDKVGAGQLGRKTGQGFYSW
jgi:3-hydroxybutyryl-CoA dehydrogenase